MRISQFAERTGVPATTLRYYESTGLVPADRTDSGYRVYDDPDVDRVAFIQAAKQVGLSLDEIRELLEVWERDPCAEVRAHLRPKMIARLADVNARNADLTAFADRLRGALTRLDDLPDRAEPCDAGCDFLALQGGTRTVDLPFVLDGVGAVKSEPPIACSLEAADHGARLNEWRQVLVGATREPVPAGVRLQLPITRVGALAELAAAEQRCCPFFEFSLHLHGADVVLDVRAPADAAGMVHRLFGHVRAVTSAH